MMMLAAAAMSTSMFTKTEMAIHDNLYKNFYWLKIAEIVVFLTIPSTLRIDLNSQSFVIQTDDNEW